MNMFHAVMAKGGLHGEGGHATPTNDHADIRGAAGHGEPRVVLRDWAQRILPATILNKRNSKERPLTQKVTNNKAH